MNIQEAMEQGIKGAQPTANQGWLDEKTNVTDLDCDAIERLVVSTACKKGIPDLKLFPNTKSFLCFKTLSVQELEKFDLTNLEEIWLSVSGHPTNISIHAPKLKKIAIRLPDNCEPQKLGTLDISDCVALEKIELCRFAGYKVLLGDLSNLKSVVLEKYSRAEMDFLQNTPSLIHLTAFDCQLEEVGFLSYFPELEFLDLSDNNIKKAEKVFDLPNLQELCLYRNPLENAEKYYSAAKKVLISKKDKEKARFTEFLSTCYCLAYKSLLAARVPDSKRPRALQHLYDNHTDEWIFIDKLVMCLRTHIENELRYQTGELSLEDMHSIIVEECPFLKDYFKE